MQMNRQSYLDTVRKVQAAGYELCFFDEAKSSHSFILRHDIDFCVKSARDLARFEADNGIKSTYFFLLTTNFYTLSSERNQDLVREIRDMGHKVSVHFDAAIKGDIDSRFELEKVFFESLFDVKIDHISLHRPGSFLDDNNRPLPGVQHTYQDKYFKEMIYLSDSGGRDIADPMDAILETSNGKNIQLLVHPIWWVRPAAEPSGSIRDWFSTHYDFLTEEAKFNCRPFDGNGGLK